MDNSLGRFEPLVQKEGQGALELRVTDQRSAQEATNWLSRVRKLRKEVEDTGMKPIQEMKAQLAKMKAFVDRLINPLKAAEAHLNTQIGRFVAEEREAARRLQEEENRRVALLQKEQEEELAKQAQAAEELGEPPSLYSASLAPVMPEIIPPMKQSIKADTGEMASVRMLATYDVGRSIVDGKALPGADLTQSNPDFKGLPASLFELNLSKLRAYVKSSGEVKGTLIRQYRKPSTALREG